MYDYIKPYVEDLRNCINLQAIAAAGLKIGIDPMGGSGVAYWEPIAEEYGLDIEVVNPRTDPTFSFMTLTKTAKIRMDCSHPCHGKPGQTQRSLILPAETYGRPAWHRHPQCRVDEPEPLPGDCYLVPVPKSPQLGGACRSWENAGLQLDD
jgi:hypothetical protein